MAMDVFTPSVVEGLGQVGKAVDSAVGGEKCRTRRNTEGLRSVAFWGICDIKYDPRLPPAERVKVLELGDGRSSRFSHHGRPIKVKFDEEYRMDSPPIKRAMLVENKKFTHDMFVKEGFAHLRPATISAPRTYRPDLAAEILERLAASESDGVVLKLCNRSRGAGVVVVPGTQPELDETLRRLLTLPSEVEDVESGLGKLRVERALGRIPQDLHDEQQLHWWSNECPYFLAEKLCHSMPVAKHDDDDGALFDGTMRVAFALHRKQAINKLAHMKMEPETIKPFEIDWLGGYWKLPKAASGGGVTGSLHEQIVSSFNSVDKRTAEVPEEQLAEVYEALTLALPVIFHTGVFGVPMISNLYRCEPLYCGFALARVACTMRAEEMGKAKGVFSMAKDSVARAQLDQRDNLASNSVKSYIFRNEGVCEAMMGRWDKALDKFNLSRQLLPTNATTAFLIGCALVESAEFSLAKLEFYHSLALDPDFKAPFLALGNCELKLRNFYGAVGAGVACLLRNPDAPQAQFIIGQAFYHLLYRGVSLPRSLRGIAVREKAIAALQIAQERLPNNWTKDAQQMLDGLKLSVEEMRQQPAAPVQLWKTTAWRP